MCIAFNRLYKYKTKVLASSFKYHISTDSKGSTNHFLFGFTFIAFALHKATTSQWHHLPHGLRCFNAELYLITKNKSFETC